MSKAVIFTKLGKSFSTIREKLEKLLGSVHYLFIEEKFIIFQTLTEPENLVVFLEKEINDKCTLESLDLYKGLENQGIKVFQLEVGEGRSQLELELIAALAYNHLLEGYETRYLGFIDDVYEQDGKKTLRLDSIREIDFLAMDSSDPERAFNESIHKLETWQIIIEENRDALNKIGSFEDLKEGFWFRITVRESEDAISADFYSTDLEDEEAKPHNVSQIERLDEESSIYQQLHAVFSLNLVSKSSRDDIKTCLEAIPIGECTRLIAKDVGQGNCIRLDNCQAPTAYFDVGAGIYQNKKLDLMV